jgi:hypothetical protein
LLRGGEERRAVVFCAQIDRRLCLDERLDDLQLALLGGDNERGSAVLLALLTFAFASMSALTTSSLPFWKAM